ncbi:MAG TPA: alpha/beta hydrolase-fold protein [Polyangia bacterium]|nr:alpha/beta hydrolase-fold protein [Polyangia bacterium]
MSVAIEVVESRALAGNPLGDPTARRVAVWLPPSYGRAPERRYPLILWLAGYGGTGEMMFSGSPWQPGLGARLDALVAVGKMGEAIVAAPDCFTRWGGAQYLDSPALGNYETHIIEEVIPALDQRLRTIPGREARAIGGKSSGGFGALVLAMRHADRFSAVASHAGDMAFELSLLPDLPVAARTLRRHGGIGRFLADFEAREKKSGDAFTTIMVLATAGAYSPEPGRDHGIALPFDIETGAIDWAIWQRWKAWDPVELAVHHAEALRRMKLLFLDAGTRDEHNLDLGARIFVRRLRELGVACEHEEFDDGHRATAYRYDVSIPKLAAAIGAA